MSYLSPEEFQAHAMRIIRTATADGTSANDAVTALTKALGILVGVTAKREGVAFDELLKFALEAVTEYANHAHTEP